VIGVGVIGVGVTGVGVIGVGAGVFGSFVGSGVFGSFVGSGVFGSFVGAGVFGSFVGAGVFGSFVGSGVVGSAVGVGPAVRAEATLAPTKARTISATMMSLLFLNSMRFLLACTACYRRQDEAGAPPGSSQRTSVHVDLRNVRWSPPFSPG
jgi:hypothetical protein